MNRLVTWIDPISSVAVLISLVEFTFSTLPLSEQEALVSRGVAVALRAVFAAEYIARIACTQRRLVYVRSAPGVIDLATVVLDFGPLKLLRVLKLVARASAFDRLAGAVAAVRHELAAAGGCAGALIYGSAVGIYYCERAAQPEAFGSIPDALWWAVITLTTIGYGDVAPITPMGRVFTACVAVVGLGMVAVPTGLIAAALASTSPSLTAVVLSYFGISSLRRQECSSGTTNARKPGKWVGQMVVLRTPPGCGSMPSAS